LIIDYLELLTDIPDEDIARYKEQIANSTVNPMAVKKRLAKKIVKQFHGGESALGAEEHFMKVFQKGEMPEDVVALEVVDGVTLSAELTRAGLTKSRSEARRLITQGAIEVEDQIITDDLEMAQIGEGKKIKVGKRRFAST
jgi:tyrosyl-tRNA synthetase